MANELAWGVCLGLYICTWFFTSGSLVCFFFIICMANELAWAVCPGLYICTWFFTSEKKSFYLVSQKKKKKKNTKQNKGFTKQTG